MIPSRLIGPKVLVRRSPEVEITRGGLHLPSVARERPQTGTVVASGSYKNGAPTDAQPGDLVMFPKFHDLFIWLDGEELLYFDERELLMRFE